MSYKTTMSFKLFRFIRRHHGTFIAAKAARDRGVSLANVQLWLYRTA